MINRFIDLGGLFNSLWRQEFELFKPNLVLKDYEQIKNVLVMASQLYIFYHYEDEIEEYKYDVITCFYSSTNPSVSPHAAPLATSFFRLPLSLLFLLLFHFDVDISFSRAAG